MLVYGVRACGRACVAGVRCSIRGWDGWVHERVGGWRGRLGGHGASHGPSAKRRQIIGVTAARMERPSPPPPRPQGVRTPSLQFGSQGGHGQSYKKEADNCDGSLFQLATTAIPPPTHPLNQCKPTHGGRCHFFLQLKKGRNISQGIHPKHKNALKIEPTCPPCLTVASSIRRPGPTGVRWPGRFTLILLIPPPNS